jgi:glutamate-1-semialdehyde 2,1-aminomutase
MNSGQELWQKAKMLIPGGNQILSKRPEKFLPGLWPSYYSKAKGCEVWDIDGNKYIDFAQMGVGSCVLGYSDDEVNAAIYKAIENGGMCTLNSYEEVQLAEKLIELHPWADMVRYARTGGEMCAVAIRIARAATGRTKIAFCGYHGWHDWYLASNISNSSNLDGQLLPGLDPAGVPRELMSTAIPFNYNRIDELQRLLDANSDDIGAIIMEPYREHEPEPGFLDSVRTIANKVGAVLIFDEVTSGFRMNLGGIHLKYSVEPDMAIFGKAMGNGYPIAALIGKKSVMDAAQKTFISSTMWSERVGFAAALATLRKMESNDVPDRLIEYGQNIAAGWLALSRSHNLDIAISGMPPLISLKFEYSDPLAVQTLYAQEMLTKGYLLGGSVYTSDAYSGELIEKFLNDSDQAFKKISKAIKSGELKEYLLNDTIHAGFKRLT